MASQKEHSIINAEAWNTSSYEAWVSRFGTAEEAAERIKANPAAKLRGLYRHMGELKGKKAANLLGSHGSMAVAMALLGAEATVVDISAGNARYAKELAGHAGVPLRYIVSDVLELSDEVLDGTFDLVLMEFGILHYFTDLGPLIQVVARLLGPGGRLVLQDFHPVTTKLISSRGTTANIRKHKVTGDYFDASIHETEVAYSKFLTDSERGLLPKVQLRYWNLGEIVTAVAQGGLTIRELAEEPNQSSDIFDKGIPKTFTLVADKPL